MERKNRHKQLLQQLQEQSVVPQMIYKAQVTLPSMTESDDIEEFCNVS